MRIKYDAPTDDYPETMTRFGVTFERNETKDVEADIAAQFLEYPYFNEIRKGRPKKVKHDDHGTGDTDT